MKPVRLLFSQVDVLLQWGPAMSSINKQTLKDASSFFAFKKHYNTGILNTAKWKLQYESKFIDQLTLKPPTKL